MNSIRNYYTFYRKIDKFRLNLDNVEWPDRTQEACLAANTHLKKATKTTPFRLMFGRDCNPVYLFRASDIQVGEEYSEDDPLVEPNTDENSYDIPVDRDEWMKDMDSSRDAERQVARMNIVQEQARQKDIFDAKIHRSRYTWFRFSVLQSKPNLVIVTYSG